MLPFLLAWIDFRSCSVHMSKASFFWFSLLPYNIPLRLESGKWNMTSLYRFSLFHHVKILCPFPHPFSPCYMSPERRGHRRPAARCCKVCMKSTLNHFHTLEIIGCKIHPLPRDEYLLPKFIATFE